MSRTGGSSWLAGSLMPGPLEWALGRQAEPSLVMGRWVGEESWAGRTGNSAERGQEGAMAWKLSCPPLPSPLPTILRGPCQLNHVTESTAKPGCWLSPACCWAHRAFLLPTHSLSVPPQTPGVTSVSTGWAVGRKEQTGGGSPGSRF